MSNSASNDARPGRPGRKGETLARKFVIAFSAMFILPLLVAVYLFTETAAGSFGEPVQLFALMGFVILLGAAGFLTSRSVVHALLHAAKEAASIAEGDLTRRLNTDAASEISELAKNFNRITSRLQESVDRLQSSKQQMQTLLSQVCAGASQPHDLSNMFRVFLDTLLSLTGLNVGAIFLLSPDGKVLRVRLSAGLPEAMKSTVIPVGEGIVGWVATHQQMVTVSESMPWGKRGGLTELEKSMPWSIHLPMGVAGKIRGVLSIGLREGQKEITGDDLLMIQNLATQVAVALENADLKGSMETTYVETVAALAAAVEARDPYTRGHSRRVTEYSVAIARKMNQPDWFVKDVESAALLHDIGKIGMPDHVLHNTKPDLPPDGVPIVLGHPIGGENILKPVGSLARLCPIVRHHHERYDGKGYPDGLAGGEIPLAARILAVADAFDAMTSARAYKTTRTREEAMHELSRCAESQFDPRCVVAFVEYMKEAPEAGDAVPAC